jgi:hypothetical protein
VALHPIPGAQGHLSSTTWPLQSPQPMGKQASLNAVPLEQGRQGQSSLRGSYHSISVRCEDGFFCVPSTLDQNVRAKEAPSVWHPPPQSS